MTDNEELPGRSGKVVRGICKAGLVAGTLLWSSIGWLEELDSVVDVAEEGLLLGGRDVKSSFLDWPRLSNKDLKVNAEDGCNWLLLPGVESGDVVGSVKIIISH